jgi:hypothetical protein
MNTGASGARFHRQMCDVSLPDSRVHGLRHAAFDNDLFDFDPTIGLQALDQRRPVRWCRSPPGYFPLRASGLLALMPLLTR